MAGRPRVCVGLITGPHGVRGLVRVKSFTAEPAAMVEYGTLGNEAGTRRFDLALQSTAKGQFIARIDGVADREAAEALRGVRLYVDRDLLPEPEEPEDFYYTDLIGLSVETVDGQPFGRVRSVDDFGAGDIVDIDRVGGGTACLPFTRLIFPTVDIAGGRLVVDPPDETEVRDS